MLIIGTITLIVVGPNRLPDLARKLGGIIRVLRSASSELKQSFKEELDKNTSSEMEDLNQLADDIRSYNPKNKNIEDFLESAADAWDSHDNGKKETAKKNKQSVPPFPNP